jgi:hypothetical protein
MSLKLLNWKSGTPPDEPGFTHFFCSINNPNSGVTVLFTDQYSPNPELLVGHHARSVGRWDVASMLEVERALVAMLGGARLKPSGVLDVKLFDLHERCSPDGGDLIALKLIEGAISNIAEKLIASGVRIWPNITMPMIDCSVPDKISPVADEPEQINDILGFDSEIESIVESPAEEKLVYYLKCIGTPTQRESSRFKAVVFSGYCSHKMEKATSAKGPQKIIDIAELTKEGSLTSFRITTNAGDRLICAKDAYVTRLSTL